jgi:DNA (cytosine-5)-methyltransferase 1
MPMNSGRDYKAREVEVSQPVLASGPTNGNQGGDFVLSFGDVARTLSHRYDGSPCDDRRPDIVAQSHAVRRLTPTECERLQGFPDGFTSIPWRGKPADQCPDAPRYKAIGNSMAVPVMAWIGKRIQMVEEIA